MLVLGQRVGQLGRLQRHLDRGRELGGGEIEAGRILNTHGILGQHARLILYYTVVREQSGLGGVLAELFGDIGVGEALIGGVIVLVADGRICALVYKVARLVCDTHRELERGGFR